MFRRISVFSKKIAVAAAIALAMTSLSACGDSGKKDDASERTTHTISNVKTESTTELTTAATTNDTSDDTTSEPTTVTEQSSDTKTEATTEKPSDDIVIAATQKLADIYKSGNMAGLMDAVPDGLMQGVYTLIKTRVSGDFLAEGDITDGESLKSWIAFYLGEMHDDEYQYNVEITGDAKEMTTDDFTAYLSSIGLENDASAEFISNYLDLADKFYSVPIKVSVKDNTGTELDTQDTTDVVFLMNGKAYSFSVITSFVPAIVKYIDKSATADDNTIAQNIRVAVETALANEDAYNDVNNAIKAAAKDAYITAKDKDGNDKQYLIIASVSKDGVIEMRNGVPAGGDFNTEMNYNISKAAIRFIAYGADRYTVAIDEECYQTAVFIGTADNEIKWQITPDTDPQYR